MADVRITPTKVPSAGASEAFTAMATADTYKVRNNGRMLLHFKKTGAGAATITLTTPRTIAGFAVADQTVNVPASTGDVMVALAKTDLFNDSAGDVSFTTDEATGLTVAAVRI